MQDTGNVQEKAAYFKAETDSAYLDWPVGRLLAERARQIPERIALVVPAGPDGLPERRWTYRELEATAHKVAQALLARFAPGDHVATWAGASPEILLLQFGAALAGIILVTVNPANRAGELQYLLELGQARGLFLDRVYRNLDNVEALASINATLPQLETIIYIDEWEGFLAQGRPVVLPEVAPEAPALVLFTSGSTGKPKAAVLSHAGILNNAALTAQRLGVPPGTVWLNTLPMFHIGGAGTLTLGCLANAGTQVMLPAFSPEAMLDTLERYKVGIAMAVPTMLLGLLDHPAFPATDLSHLEVIVVGGTPVPPALLHRVKASIKADISTLMGQTEAGGAMFTTRRGDAEELVTGSVGPPIALSEVKVIAPADGRTLVRGEIGEICIRARSVMLGYFGAPEKTRETLDKDGWLHTGDLGLMLGNGYIQVTGRLKEMIIRGGENIYPREVEDVLAEHPAISQAAVFGIPDEKWGEQVAAAVILRANETVEFPALQDYLKARIASHKIPKIWRAVKSFPLNTSGKIQKFLLQEQIAAEEARLNG
jgi:fatty-acyl-CoA synthase